MSIKNWLGKNTESLAAKKVAVTGTTGGLGRELCRYLAFLGAELLFLDRSEQRSLAHRSALLAEFPDCKIECFPLDLEDLHSAKRAVDKLIEWDVDIVIHNAGAYKIDRRTCHGGYDNIFQINFATPYYMTRQLLPHLRSKHGRVLAVGSVAHTYSHIDEADVDFKTRTACSKVYGNAKRYLMFALHELFKEETQVQFALVHPGITFTNITAHYPKLIFAVIKYPMKVIFMKPRKAALCLIRGVFEDTEYCEWIGPPLFDVWGYPKKKTLMTCPESERKKIEELAETVYQNCSKAAQK